jgi:hypothetical protein
MSNDPIRVRCMEFLHSQLEKKAIPHIRPGMLEDLIALVEGVRSDLAAQVMAQRMAEQARMAELEEKNKTEVSDE